MGRILRLVHSSAVNTNTVEINYKCLTRWYITPDKACKAGKTSECWRGCKVVATMAHIWWDCPKINLERDFTTNKKDIQWRNTRRTLDVLVSWGGRFNKAI